MSRGQRVDYVVCYDITDPRRIQRMHRYLRRWGTPLQYSVFHCRLNDRERQSLISGLHEKINEKTDDVRLYAIQASGRILCLGQKPLPEEIQVYGLHQVFAGQFDQSGGRCPCSRRILP